MCSSKESSVLVTQATPPWAQAVLESTPFRFVITATRPQASTRISYAIPTFEIGKRRLYLGAWSHGISLYGWQQGQDGGFAERHPALVTGKGTIRLRPVDAEAIDDDELRDLITGALGD